SDGIIYYIGQMMFDFGYLIFKGIYFLLGLIDIELRYTLDTDFRQPHNIFLCYGTLQVLYVRLQAFIDSAYNAFPSFFVFKIPIQPICNKMAFQRSKMRLFFQFAQLDL